MKEKAQITELNAKTFEFQKSLDTVFSKDSDYIEYYIFDESQNKILPQNGTLPLTTYSVIKGHINLFPETDLRNHGINNDSYYILYNFYRKRLKSDYLNKYYIKEISSDRTEIRLDSNIISNEDIISTSNEFIKHREKEGYFVDFLLNFGDNKSVIANNIKLDTTLLDDPTILIKLYEPLPEDFELKTEL